MTGAQDGGGSKGAVVILASEQVDEGSMLGLDEYFTGLALVLDTADEAEEDSPIVYATVNDGSKEFKGKASRFGGCKAQKFRNRETLIEIGVTYDRGWLEVALNLDGSGNYQRCFRRQVNLATYLGEEAYLGFSGMNDKSFSEAGVGDTHMIGNVEYRDLTSERALHSQSIPLDGADDGDDLVLRAGVYGRVHGIWHDRALEMKEWRIEFDLSISGDPYAPGQGFAFMVSSQRHTLGQMYGSATRIDGLVVFVDTSEDLDGEGATNKSLSSPGSLANAALSVGVFTIVFLLSFRWREGHGMGE